MQGVGGQCRPTEARGAVDDGVERGGAVDPEREMVQSGTEAGGEGRAEFSAPIEPRTGSKGLGRTGEEPFGDRP